MTTTPDGTCFQGYSFATHPHKRGGSFLQLNELLPTQL